MRMILIAGLLLALGACANTGNETADTIIDTAPMAVFWWITKTPPF